MFVHSCMHSIIIHSFLYIHLCVHVYSCYTTMPNNVNAALVLHSESALWLMTISKRLAGQVAVRCPYSATISRHIPYDLFKVARRTIEYVKDAMLKVLC